MTIQRDGGSISVAQEYESYDWDEDIHPTTIYSSSLTIDAMKIRESTVQFVNKGNTEIKYKIFGSAKKGQKFKSINPEIGDEWINLLSKETIYNHAKETTIPASVFATGTLTCSSVVVGDTVTINGLVYTAVDVEKSDNTEFQIGVAPTTDTPLSANDTTALNLSDSINNDTRVGITISNIGIVSTNTTNVVTITASITGEAGNDIDTSTTGGTITSNNTTLTTGVDSRSFETFGNPWRYVTVMTKSSSGVTPTTIKIWHRGEN